MSKRSGDKHWSGYSSSYFNKLVKKEHEKILQSVRIDDDENLNLSLPTCDEVPPEIANRLLESTSESLDESLSDLDEDFYNMPFTDEK